MDSLHDDDVADVITPEAVAATDGSTNTMAYSCG